MRERTPSPKERENVNVILETPPQRIFPELTGIAQYQREKRTFNQEGYQGSKNDVSKATEQEVVEVVEKYRKGLLEEEVRMSSGSSSLKKDYRRGGKRGEVLPKTSLASKEVDYER
jgi:hypothetical protein